MWQQLVSFRIGNLSRFEHKIAKFQSLDVKTAPVNISNNTTILNGDTYDGNDLDSNFDEDDDGFL